MSRNLRYQKIERTEAKLVFVPECKSLPATGTLPTSVPLLRGTGALILPPKASHGQTGVLSAISNSQIKNLTTKKYGKTSPGKVRQAPKRCL